MKPWLVVVIYRLLGRAFNDPNTIYRLEDKLANSGPIRQFARLVAGLLTRGSWELKQLTQRPNRLNSGEPISEVQEEFRRKLKKLEQELKRRMEGK